MSRRLPSGAITDGTRILMTEVIRKPVKQAVRDALREETIHLQIRESGEGGQTATLTAPESTARSESEGGASTDTGIGEGSESESDSGRSPLLWGGLALLTAMGVSYYIRHKAKPEHRTGPQSQTTQPQQSTPQHQHETPTAGQDPGMGAVQSQSEPDSESESMDQESETGQS